MRIDRLLVDRGHGASNRRVGVYDPGAVSRTHTEHGIVATLAEDLMDRQGLPCPVMLTPETQLGEVVTWVNANGKHGDVLFALHMNASDISEATGTEVIVSHLVPEYRDPARRLAGTVAHVLGIHNRGILSDLETPAGKKRGLAILSRVQIPAFLIELGFISNEDDTAAVVLHGVDAIIAGLYAIRS